MGNVENDMRVLKVNKWRQIHITEKKYASVVKIPRFSQNLRIQE